MNKKDFLKLVMETIESLPDSVVIERMDITETKVDLFVKYVLPKPIEKIFLRGVMSE